jgi:cell division control protein 7
VTKNPDYRTAIDIWSVGIMLLCFLTRRFPFFNSNDDIEALMEIATIFGGKRIESCGALHSTCACAKATVST